MNQEKILPTDSKIQEVIAALKPDLKLVDQIILDFSVGKSPLVKEISHHLIASGGKRIRPVLLILAAKMSDLNAKKNPHNLAAAIELIHSATLLHDDVVDASEVRRGNKTANAIWDNKASILVGDYLFSIAFQLMVRDNDLRILDVLSKASSVMADGEVMQLENSSNINISQEKYLEIIFGKTAVLFSAATESAALLNKRPEDEIASLREFGKNLGIIFQIIDDLLDYKADATKFGKNLGGDFFEGKITLPIIIAYKNAENTDKTCIQELCEKNLLNSEKNVEDFNQIMFLINKYNGFELSLELASQYKNLAIKNLSIFADSIYKDYLLEILHYSFNRKS